MNTQRQQKIRIEAGASEQTDREALALRLENEALRREISRLKRLTRLAYQDHLTGLANRRYFYKRIGEELARVHRYPDRTFSLVLVDVNDFKRINDRLGHLAGDRTLQRLAALLEAKTRGQDVCCRLAGDEFIVLLPDTDRKDCTRAVARLRRHLEEANRKFDLPISISVGSATFPHDGTTLEALFTRADACMYQDKARQKGAEAVRRGASQAQIPTRARQPCSQKSDAIVRFLVDPTLSPAIPPSQHAEKQAQ